MSCHIEGGRVSLPVRSHHRQVSFFHGIEISLPLEEISTGVTTHLNQLYILTTKFDRFWMLEYVAYLPPVRTFMKDIGKSPNGVHLTLLSRKRKFRFRPDPILELDVKFCPEKARGSSSFISTSRIHIDLPDRTFLIWGVRKPVNMDDRTQRLENGRR